MRLVGERADQGEAQRQVGARLGEAHATDGRGEHLVLAHRQPRPPLEHGEQQRQATGVEALRAAPRRHAGA